MFNRYCYSERNSRIIKLISHKNLILIAPYSIEKELHFSKELFYLIESTAQKMNKSHSYLHWY